LIRRSRLLLGSVPAAAATSAVKTINGNSAPSLAAANGLVGTSVTMNSTMLPTDQLLKMGYASEN
jgi:hypothetical protein